MTMKSTALFLALMLAAACGGSSETTQSNTAAETSTGDESPSEQGPIVGGDRDEHGCIGSAGYRWCARENACTRSWELASQRGFENSQAAFEQYCAGN